jgi:hypothetical protein
VSRVVSRQRAQNKRNKKSPSHQETGFLARES